MSALLKNTVRTGEDVMKNRFLTFYIGKEIFGIEIRFVTKIIGIQPLTEIPETADYIKGIIYMRERVVPVIDIGIRFNFPERKYDEKTCIIIIDSGGILIGMIVDGISEIRTIPDKNISERPKTNIKRSHGYIKSIGKAGDAIVLLIDCEELLNEDKNFVS